VLTIPVRGQGAASCFPGPAAALAWGGGWLYIGVDFRLLGQGARHVEQRRAGLGARRAKAILAATLLVFLFAYLNLSRWHVRYSHITIGWLTFSRLAGRGLRCSIPRSPPGIARMSLVLIAFAGFALIVYLSTHGFDRAVLC